MLVGGEWEGGFFSKWRWIIIMLFFYYVSNMKEKKSHQRKSSKKNLWSLQLMWWWSQFSCKSQSCLGLSIDLVGAAASSLFAYGLGVLLGEFSFWRKKLPGNKSLTRGDSLTQPRSKEAWVQCGVCHLDPSPSWMPWIYIWLARKVGSLNVQSGEKSTYIANILLKHGVQCNASGSDEKTKTWMGGRHFPLSD